MVDNERLIQVFAETSKYLSSQLPVLLEAEAPPQAIHRYIESWSNLLSLITVLEEQPVREERLLPVTVLHSDNSSSLIESLRSIERRLDFLSEKLDKIEQGGSLDESSECK